MCSQASRSRATLSCDSSYFSYWQGTIFYVLYFTGEECQKNGTVFKPNRPKRDKEESLKKSRDEEEEEEEKSDTDSLSDLYPGTHDELPRKKTCFQGFWPGPTQTSCRATEDC